MCLYIHRAEAKTETEKKWDTQQKNVDKFKLMEFSSRSARFFPVVLMCREIPIWIPWKIFKATNSFIRFLKYAQDNKNN